VTLYAVPASASAQPRTEQYFTTNSIMQHQVSSKKFRATASTQLLFARHKRWPRSAVNQAKLLRLHHTCSKGSALFFIVNAAFEDQSDEQFEHKPALEDQSEGPVCLSQIPSEHNETILVLQVRRSFEFIGTCPYK
jgi:hypothetical protein